MPPISRGFRGRRQPGADPARLPPGQYLTPDFPVLSAGPTEHTALEDWSLTIDGAVDEQRAGRWDGAARAAPGAFTVDIHCVTKWSKFDTSWTGVSLDVLLDGVDTGGDYVTAWSRRRIHDQPAARGPHRRQGLGRPHLRRRAARARARRPGAPARPAPVLLEEREVGARPHADRRGRAGLLGVRRLPQLRGPVAGAALLERLRRPAPGLADRHGPRRRGRDAAGAHAGPRRARLDGPPRRASTSTCA